MRGQRMVGEVVDDAQPHVGQRAHRQRHRSVDQALDERGVLEAADAVVDALHAEQVQRLRRCRRADPPRRRARPGAGPRRAPWRRRRRTSTADVPPRRSPVRLRGSACPVRATAPGRPSPTGRCGRAGSAMIRPLLTPAWRGGQRRETPSITSSRATHGSGGPGGRRTPRRAGHRRGRPWRRYALVISAKSSRSAAWPCCVVQIRNDCRSAKSYAPRARRGRRRAARSRCARPGAG